MISTIPNKNEKLDVSMLNNGVYLIEIIANGSKIIKKPFEIASFLAMTDKSTIYYSHDGQS